MRLYHGVDIVDIEKLRGICERHRDIVKDLFTEREREYCLSRREPYVHFGGRFAAKEALLKALGVGLSGSGIDAALQEIEVVPLRSGRPEILMRGWVEKICGKRRIEEIALSISHTEQYAVASVIGIAASGKRSLQE
jgi:holo-[acyl-carrier protein] synthase